MFAFKSGIKTSKGTISPVQFLILLTLARREKGTHGYDILKTMKCGFRGGWIPKSGTLYPALDRLADSGLVEKQEIKQSETDRTYRYTLTDEGKKTVNEVLEMIPDSFRGIGTFWHYVTRHAPQKFQKDSKWRRHLIERLLPRYILTEHFDIETEKSKEEELQWLETYKQQLQEELDKINENLKKIRAEK